MKVIINGAHGRMGQMLTACVEETEGFEIAARVSRSYALVPEADMYQTLEQYDGPADCVIDFSNHSETGSLLGYCVMRGLPVVIATTGQSEEELHQIQTAIDDIPVFLSANMSLGVAVLADLAKRTAAMFPDADIEIIERHHNQKLDVPSGTALLLAKRVQEARPDAVFVVGRHENGKRERNEIGIHALRYGTETGTHEIIFSNGKETITLKHEAESRMLFAQGALVAAKALVGMQPGLYDMRSIFE